MIFGSTPQPPIPPRALSAFLKQLREVGYNVGVEQHVAVEKLLLSLAARGELPRRPEALRSLLGPVLCSTPLEQADFAARFDDLVARLQQTAGLRRATAPRIFARFFVWLRGRSLWAWQLIAAGLGIFLVAIAVWIALRFELLVAIAVWIASRFELPRAAQILPDWLPASGQTSSLLVWLAGLATVGAAVYLASRWWGRRYLTRRGVRGEVRLRQLFVGRAARRLFPQRVLQAAARKLRVYRRVLSDELDLEATAEQTCAEAGWFTPVFATRPELPEYLAVVERASLRDHGARLVDALLDQLEAEDVVLARRYFDRDPRLCTAPGSRAAPESLDQLAARQSGQRLWLFSDGSGLFNPFTGKLARWVGRFRAWPTRGLLTPQPAVFWGGRETALATSGFDVLPATAEGLAASVDPALTPAEEERSARLFPASLRDQPRRWLAPDPPPRAIVERCLAEVRTFLGAEAWQWLHACAVFPDLRWELTLFLGRRLRDGDGRPLFDVVRLRCLARLPWFRAGYLPDWLRARLLEELSGKRHREVRDLLRKLLLSAEGRPAAGFSLEIAEEGGAALRWLWRAFRRRLAAEDSDHPLIDRITMSYLDDHLAVRVPRAVGRLLRGLRRRRAGEPRRSFPSRLRRAARERLEGPIRAVVRLLRGIGPLLLGLSLVPAFITLLGGVDFRPSPSVAILFVIAGTILIYMGGEVLVDNSIRMARSFGVSSMVIGLTVVAFATSAPELAVALTAALGGSPGLMLGTVLGSNVVNLGLILGLAALLMPLRTTIRFIRREVAFMVFATILVYPLMATGASLGRLEGLFLLIMLTLFLATQLREAGAPETEEQEGVEEAGRPPWLSALGVFLAIVLLVGGAQVLVRGASVVAQSLGVGERVIGLSLVALATSLPELAAGLVAARRREADLVLGNVIGSNIFNLLAVLGLVAMTQPFPVGPSTLSLDFWVMLVLSVLVLVMLPTKRELKRVEGAMLLALYLGFMAFLFLS